MKRLRVQSTHLGLEFFILGVLILALGTYLLFGCLPCSLRLSAGSVWGGSCGARETMTEHSRNIIGISPRGSFCNLLRPINIILSKH